MRPGAGKSKGSAFEREVCRRLSLWLSQGQRDDLLWRSAMSGGRATVQFKTGKVNLTQSGDVSAIGQEAYSFCEKIFTEIKHYADLSIGRGFLCHTGNLVTFWHIAVREAAKYGKSPLLVARQNRYPTMALTTQSSALFAAHVPVLAVNSWDTPANVYLFDAVTKVKAKMVRGN